MKILRQTVDLMQIVLLAILAVYAGAALILDHLPNPVFKRLADATVRAEMLRTLSQPAHHARADRAGKRCAHT